MSGYLSFRGSGHALVDGILSAIESAGNAFHNTGDWEDNELGPIESSARNAAARIAALEAEVAQLRSGIHPPVNPMPGGFSLENFMPGLKPEDADAFCEALDAASPDLSDSREECPRCGSSYIVDGKCKSMDSECEEIFELRAALAREDAALGMAVEALDEVSDSYGSHYQGGGCSCVKCRRTRRHAALAACREAMGETP